MNPGAIDDEVGSAPRRGAIRAVLAGGPGRITGIRSTSRAENSANLIVLIVHAV
jgi:hypothetical protein